MTDGLGAHSVVEAVGTQEAMMQAIRSTRPGGHVGFVGVSHGVQLPGLELFFAEVHLLGGPAPVWRPAPLRSPVWRPALLWSPVWRPALLWRPNGRLEQRRPAPPQDGCGMRGRGGAC